MKDFRKGRITSDGTGRGTKVILGDGTELSTSNIRSINIRIEPGSAIATIEVLVFLPQLDVEVDIAEKQVDV